MISFGVQTENRENKELRNGILAAKPQIELEL
jgi:hypothetical protein